MSIEMVMAHSRGVLPMMQYFGSVDTSQRVPYLVNCCGRYFSEGLLKRYTKLYPKWREEKGFWTKTFYHGKYVDYWVPESEILSTGQFPIDCFKSIPSSTQVINIYGTFDNTIPKNGTEQYHLTFGDRSFQFWIPGSDHNLYGLINDNNHFNLPTMKGKVKLLLLLLLSGCLDISWYSSPFVPIYRWVTDQKYTDKVNNCPFMTLFIFYTIISIPRMRRI